MQFKEVDTGSWVPKGKNTKTGKKKKAPGPAGTVEMHEVALQEEGEMVHMEQEETHQENNCVVNTGTSIFTLGIHLWGCQLLRIIYILEKEHSFISSKYFTQLA